MRERAVRARREPGGGKRRTQAYLPNRLLHPSGHQTWPFWFTSPQTFLIERTKIPPMVFTNHETRITAFYRMLRPSGGETCRLPTLPGLGIGGNLLRGLNRTSLRPPHPRSCERIRPQATRCCPSNFRLCENSDPGAASRLMPSPEPRPALARQSDISYRANQDPAHGFHESRDTNHGLLSHASTVGW